MIALKSLGLSMEGLTAILELSHGKANEMGAAEIGEFERLAAWLETGEARTLITFSRRTSGKGTPIFIAGANVTERAEWTVNEVKAHVRRQREALARLRRAPVFHVAVVHGIALGWGTEFLLCCDWRIATFGARFGLPETGLGILPGAGGSSELASMIGLPNALRLGMTGEQVNVDEAHRMGLVDEVAASLDAGLSRARAMAANVEKRSPTAVAAFKAAAQASIGLDTDDRRVVEARAYEHCVDTGEAAIGRSAFAAITTGESTPAWGPYKVWRP